MKKTQLFTESTEVPAERSLAEITGLLIHAGACAISTNFAPGGKIESVSFVLPYGAGRIPYLLPARIDPVFKKLNKRRDTWGRFSQKAMAAKVSKKLRPSIPNNPAIALLDADMEVLDQHVLDVLDFATEFEIDNRLEYDWAYRPSARDPREPFLPETPQDAAMEVL